MPTISSRTPEGVPNRCPICNARVCIEPSQAPGDGPCPACGNLLWFSPNSDGVVCFDYQFVMSIRERLFARFCANLGVNPDAVSDSTSFFADIGADSLEMVELMMEIEEEFGISIPDEDAGKIRNIADLIDYLTRRLNQ